ncbi:unnamed protein product [Brassica oleracea var. botrytis]|uniref:uncharacterized protein LOC106410957 n=1 Tax=Brassica napus TaxID=3708 RepID=UPI0006AA805F|nr:uncharacterized protein LOC106410957 [Brassica napus]
MKSQLLDHSEDTKNGEGSRKRLKISVAHFDNPALIKTYSKTLALFTNLPKIWKMEEEAIGTDLGFGRFQFDFKTEEDPEAVLKQQPFHFDYWMLSLARWQPKQSKSFPSKIMFWIRIIGVPLEFRTVAVDLDAFKELCLKLRWISKEGSSMMGKMWQYHFAMKSSLATASFALASVTRRSYTHSS